MLHPGNKQQGERTVLMSFLDVQLEENISSAASCQCMCAALPLQLLHVGAPSQTGTATDCLQHAHGKEVALSPSVRVPPTPPGAAAGGPHTPSRCVRTRPVFHRPTCSCHKGSMSPECEHSEADSRRGNPCYWTQGATGRMKHQLSTLTGLQQQQNEQFV